MPFLIDDVDFSDLLKKPSTNKQAAKSFLAKYPKDYVIEGFDVPLGFRLVSAKSEKSIRLIDIRDRAEPRIVYAVDIILTGEIINNRFCTQVMVWASPSNEDLLIGLPRKVFNHFLERYIIVVSDDEQTADGKRFWERRISNAFADNNHVYYIENDQPREILSVDDFFENFESIGWGKSEVHKERLFAISKIQLLN